MMTVGEENKVSAIQKGDKEVGYAMMTVESKSKVGEMLLRKQN